MTTLFALLLTLLPPLDGPDRLRRETTKTIYPLDRLTVEEADGLDGKTITCRVQLATSSTEFTPWFVYEGRTFDEVQKTVYFQEEPQDETKLLTVTGRLRVIRWQPKMIGMETFEGFVELRLDATTRQ
jgi:hypothetical protein